MRMRTSIAATVFGRWFAVKHRRHAFVQKGTFSLSLISAAPGSEYSRKHVCHALCHPPPDHPTCVVPASASFATLNACPQQTPRRRRRRAHAPVARAVDRPSRHPTSFGAATALRPEDHGAADFARPCCVARGCRCCSRALLGRLPARALGLPLVVVVVTVSSESPTEAKSASLPLVRHPRTTVHLSL